MISGEVCRVPNNTESREFLTFCRIPDKTLKEPGVESPHFEARQAQAVRLTCVAVDLGLQVFCGVLSCPARFLVYLIRLTFGGCAICL